MKQQPSVVLERMVLRPLMAKNAAVVQLLARSRKVAYMTHWLLWARGDVGSATRRVGQVVAGVTGRLKAEPRTLNLEL